jgi:acetoin utilization deacetylase AcuC-like enzyme
MVRTGFVFDERYLWHDPGDAALVMAPGPFVEPYRHIENADAKRRLHNLLIASGLIDRLQRIKPRAATDEEILRVHTPAYLARIKRLSAEGGGEAGFNARFGAGGFEIAALAAGGVIAAVEAVLARTVRNAYALVRPPGHHAEADRGLGFCIFGNCAIAGRHALAAHGLERIAFVDWDVHAGNGTQAVFYDDPRALTISIHQERAFAAVTGDAEEIGEGAGKGYNLNVPLPAGCGDGAYRYAFERIVLPALHTYRPQLIIVPCGFDAGIFDPLARMMLHSDAFRALAQMVLCAADELCHGRLVLAHEGGYCPATVPFFGLAVIEALVGERTEVVDPFVAIHAKAPGQALQPHQRELIDRLAVQAERTRAACWH